MEDKKKIKRLKKIAKEVEESISEEVELVYINTYDRENVDFTNDLVKRLEQERLKKWGKEPDVISDEAYYRIDKVNCRKGKKHMMVKSRFDILDL